MRWALVLISLAVLAGCRCTEREPTPGWVGVPNGSGAGGGTLPDAGPSPDGGADAGTCPRCAPDGLSVITCGGQTTRCAANQACDEGACVDACALAVAEQSTVGCEFYMAAVPPQFETFGSCYAVFLANARALPVQLEVSLGTQPLDANDFARRPVRQNGTLEYRALPTVGGKPSLGPGEMAILFLADRGAAGGTNHIDCPVTPAVRTEVQHDGTTRFDAFHVKTTAPVAAWDIFPYGGAASYVTSASLLLPTSAWSTTHVVMTPAPQSYVQLIAAADDTLVQMAAPGGITGSNELPGALPGDVASWTLARGEVAQLSQTDELGGAFVRSNKPVAVVGGSACMNKPSTMLACDSAHQQLPGVPQLSHEYVGVRHPARTGGSQERALWRVVGVVDGTSLTWTPPVSGAPTTLAAGEQVEFSAPGPFVVTAQDDAHVFAIAQLMTGGYEHDGLGDPDFVLLVPPGQWLTRHLFFTDPTYATTHTVFVRRAVGTRFAEVKLDCGPALSWRPITVDTQYAVRSWSLDGTDGCENGVHTATSTQPFTITVWGVDQYASYAWPSGMGVRQLNTVDAGFD